MFLKKSTATINGKKYNHFKIVESYREDGKVKHRILFNVGKLTDEQAEQLKLAISLRSDPSLFVANESQFTVTRSLAYLPIMLLHQLWKQWELDHFFADNRWTEALVLNRLLDPTSKIRLQAWTETTILPALLPALRSYDEYDVYRELDRIAKQEQALQTFLYDQLKRRERIQSDAFFYDITSSYFEGSRCVIAKLGYSRDHRQDREQVVIALMITPEGYPFYWQVLEGNTQDVTTIEALVRDVREQFGIMRCMLVFDRGMVSASNLQTIEHQELNYVSAMDKDEIRTTVLDDVMPHPASTEHWKTGLDKQGYTVCDGNEELYYLPFYKDGKRYVITFDVRRFHDQTEHRQRQMKQVEQTIQDLNADLKSAKKSRKYDRVENEVNRILSRKHFKKQAHVTIEEQLLTVMLPNGKTRIITTFHVTLHWLEDRLQELARLDGLTCFTTNMNADEVADQEVIEWYRRKNKVEEAFHEIKSHLQLRPMHVTRTERVKAHVTICMLAYFLMNDMEQLLKAANDVHSTVDVLQSLQPCQMHRIEMTHIKKSMLKIQELTDQQRRWIQILQCEEILLDKNQKQVIKQVEEWL